MTGGRGGNDTHPGTRPPGAGVGRKEPFKLDLWSCENAFLLL